MSANDKDNINDPGMVNDVGMYPQQQPLNFDKVWQMFQETDRLFKEQSSELNKKFQETDKKLKKAIDLFTCQWDRLVESLVEGDLPRVLRERGIKIKRTVERAKSEEEPGREFDIIAVAGDVCVVVEVKTTLQPDNVVHFINTI